MQKFSEYITEVDQNIKEKKKYEKKISDLLLKKLFIGGTKQKMISRVDNVTKIKFTTAGFVADYGFKFEKEVQNLIEKMKETDVMLYTFSGIDYEIDSVVDGRKLDITLTLTYTLFNSK